MLRPACPDDFITPDGKVKVYIKPGHLTLYTRKEKYKSQCSSSCKSMGKNGKCDAKCNTMRCLYDNGECGDAAHRKLHEEGYSAYHTSVLFVNYLLDFKYKYVFYTRKYRRYYNSF